MHTADTSTGEATLPLSATNLDRLARRIEVPAYDRSALEPGIVHFGVGGFHRAHQATYLDRLAEHGGRDWGVVGVSVRSPRARDALAPQDHLYTVIERDRDSERARVIGILSDVIFAPDDPAKVVRRLADPATRIVTLTVTGDAYAPRDGEAAGQGGVFGLIVEGLAERRRRGLDPFTVASCDNVPDNGRAAKAATLAAAGRSDRGLRAWIDSRGAFPSSVVDRITPGPTAAAGQIVRERFGVVDRSPVLAEPYAQWTLEDDFSLGRPDLEAVGVEFVDDVRAHETAKKRLLNGAHCALGYLGALAGHRRTDEALAEPLLADYLRSLMDEEIAPLLADSSAIDLNGYAATLIERFSNPAIGDELSRLAARGSTKMPAYLLPSVEDALADGRRIERLSLAVAAWLRYLRGRDLSGRPIEVVDPRAERLAELARRGGDDPRPLLSEASIFGDLGRSQRFVDCVARDMRCLGRDGVLATLRARQQGSPMLLATR